MGSFVAHLNYTPSRAAGVNFWFFIAVPSGGGCWYKAKCEMRDAATQNRRRNEHAKLWIFYKIAKWWWHAPRLTATAVGTDSRYCFLKRWHVVNVKKHCRRWPGNPNGRLKFRKYHAYLPILSIFTSMRLRLVLRCWRERQLPWIQAIIFRRHDTLPTSNT